MGALRGRTPDRDRTGPIRLPQRVPLSLADWFQSCGVKTVALQSTGVYWIPLYDILERAWLRGLSGERPAHQESARTEERCARKPVVAEATHLRIVE